MHEKKISEQPKYDSEKFKNILHEMDELYKNIQETSNENNIKDEEKKPNIFVENKTDLKIDDILNSLNSISSNMNPNKINNANNVINNSTNSININTKAPINNDVFNYFKNSETGNNIKIEPQNNILNSQKSEVSNINIYNIHNNINTIKIEENVNLEKIANSFLFHELSKSNLHWLISSKDIQIENKIGFGGSSEVFQANYRGTDVAVKKLRILDVKEENLKEFKREVK